MPVGVQIVGSEFVDNRILGIVEAITNKWALNIDSCRCGSPIRVMG